MSITPEQFREMDRRNEANKNRHRENKPDIVLPHPVVERHEAPALGGAGSGKEAGVGRVNVRFIGHRTRPLDPDNFAGSVKDLLDGLRHAGLIPGDETWRIKLETEQVKVKHRTEEKTIIEIISEAGK